MIYILLLLPTRLKFLTSFLVIHKVVAPSSIPTKVLKVLKKDISNQLVCLVNLSVSSRIFPNLLKTSDIKEPIRKTRNIKVQTIDQVPHYQILIKFLERIMCNRLYTFLGKKQTCLLFSIWVQAKTLSYTCINSFNRKI